MKKLLFAAALIFFTSPAYAAVTSLQWGVDRTTSPWTTCVYDQNNICQGVFTIPATGGGALVPPAHGGTGVNNGANTFTIGGNTAFSGAFTFTGALTGNTNVTFPTSGTLATTTTPLAPIAPGVLGYAGAGTGVPSSLTALPSVVTNAVAPAFSFGTSLYPTIVAPITTTATSTSGSPMITVTSASGLSIGLPVDQAASFGFAPGTIITNISGLTVTASTNATTTHSTAFAIQFGSARWSATSSIIANTVGAQDGYFGGVSQGNIPGWIYQYDPASSYPSISSIVASNQVGGWRAAAFYARLSDSVAGGQNTIQPIENICLADGAGLLSGYNSWCQYEQGNLTSTLPGFHINKESDLWSGWTTANANPFLINPLGHTSVFRMASGDGQHASPLNISSYMEAVANGATAETGWIIANGALDTSSSQPSLQHIAPIIASYPNTGYEWDSVSGIMAARIYEYPVSTSPTIAYDTASTGHHEFQINGVPYLGINATTVYPAIDNTVTLGGASLAWTNIFTRALNASGGVTFGGLSVAGTVCNSASGLISTTTGKCSGDDPSDVTSVFGRTGAVIAATNDYSIGQIGGLGTGVATALGNAVNASGGVATSAVTSLASLATVGTLTGGGTGTGFTIAIGTSTVTGLLTGTNGGTGVNNGAKTLTLGASLTTTGAGTPTLAFTGSTATYTFPATTTLAGLGIAETFSATQSFSSGQVDLTNGTSNTIFLGANGTSGVSSCLGEKIQLFGTVGACGVSDFALGVIGTGMWFNVQSTFGYIWYVGGTQSMAMSTNGTLSVIGAYTAAGSVPVGTTGSCVASAFSGGATAGKFSAAICAAGTIILTAMPAAPTGYSCVAIDQTTPADLVVQTASSTTSVTFKATTVAADSIAYHCIGW